MACSRLPSELLEYIVNYIPRARHIFRLVWRLPDTNRLLKSQANLVIYCHSTVPLSRWLTETTGVKPSVVNFARAGCIPGLETSLARGDRCDEVALCAAAGYGNLEALQWIWKHATWAECTPTDNYPWHTIFCVEHAASGGHINILQWLMDQGCSLKDSKICSAAARNNQLETLQWARKRDCMWNEGTFADAVAGGHMRILKWMRESGCPWNVDTCVCAVKHGRLEILKWLREHGCPWNEAVCFYAAYKGDLEILRWVREQAEPCPWNEQTCVAAVKGGHLETLQWLRAHNCPWNRRVYKSIPRKYSEIARWARENGCPHD